MIFMIFSAGVLFCGKKFNIFFVPLINYILFCSRCLNFSSFVQVTLQIQNPVFGLRFPNLVMQGAFLVTYCSNTSHHNATKVRQLLLPSIPSSLGNDACSHFRSQNSIFDDVTPAFLSGILFSWIQSQCKFFSNSWINFIFSKSQSVKSHTLKPGFSEYHGC